MYVSCSATGGNKICNFASVKGIRLANLVKFRKEAQIVYYSLADDHVKEIIDKGFEHLWQK